MLRRSLQLITLWLFVWGVVVVASRISGVHTNEWLLRGLLGAVPMLALAVTMEWRRRPSLARVRSAYDRLNECGGVVMAQEAADMSAWLPGLRRPVAPPVRWRGARPVGLFVLSALFVLVTFLLPARMLTFNSERPLEIGQLVGELAAEVHTLKEEKILEEEKAAELEQQLDRLREQASGLDPGKTWEALDHMKESNTDLARRAAEEALSKMLSLTEAQTLASALDLAMDSGLGQETATRAAQDLAGMLKSARLEEGLMKGEIPPDLLANLDALSKEDLAKLLGAIEFNKSGMGRALTNLANLRLIDAKLLAQCTNAAVCPDPSALARFLCEGANPTSFAELAIFYCRGGVNRGPGNAQMTWKDESAAEGAKFKEEMLPPAHNLSDARFVGISRTAPELSGDNVTAAHGALAGAQGSGGGANAQTLLPRHKQTVQRFFKRDE
jgi:hypothetical protein